MYVYVTDRRTDRPTDDRINVNSRSLCVAVRSAKNPGNVRRWKQNYAYISQYDCPRSSYLPGLRQSYFIFIKFPF